MIRTNVKHSKVAKGANKACAIARHVCVRRSQAGDPSCQEHFERPAIQMNSALSEGYGRGFQAFRRGDMVAVGHRGAVLGYEASLFANRGSEIVVVILSNVFGRTWSMKKLCLHILSRMSDLLPYKEEAWCHLTSNHFFI